MSESGAVGAARVEEETNLTQRHGGTEEGVQSADESGDSGSGAEVVEGDEAGASGSGVPRREPGNQMENAAEVDSSRNATEGVPYSADVVVKREREEAVARIRNSTLPPVMRERLAAVMETSESSYLDVAVCLEAIEETLPEFLRGERRNVARPSHPVGEAFFHGTEELTDAEAETLATKQLERSGLLRGQRVRGSSE